MLPKLSERASARCTANIRRYFPDYKQARIRQSGEGLEEMETFISANKAHLSELCRAIAEGETPCIDSNWPQYGAEAPEQPEPRPSASILQEIDNKLTDQKAKIDERGPAHEEPQPTYRFNVSALQAEFDPQRDDDLSKTDARLADEFDDLEARLANVSQEGLSRHTELSGQLFTKAGA